MEAWIDAKRIAGRRDPMIYGQFIEHFHRQIYGGIFEPGSPLSDEDGMRKDVLEAVRALKVPVIRWPGGCFVSAYHWAGGIGPDRVPYFDKAWRVEEPNTFGTDEYIKFCCKVGAQPYICTNAGTGTSEEMSDWVEYCNQKYGGWAKKRKEYGNPEPFGVKYWSIGNENYGSWEMGAKTMQEWGRVVVESAKMMLRADPTIEIFAASIPRLDWNLNLLREAGDFLKWISIHGYWDGMVETHDPADYETCIKYTTAIEKPIADTEAMLRVLGYEGKIRIAFDEWNLRSWHHPGVMDFQNVIPDDDECASYRDRNDINSTYTMADAVFSACFLNTCLRHCNSVGMANFSPLVNTRGPIYAHKGGIVLRSTYHVFYMFSQYMKDIVVDAYAGENPTFTAGDKEIEALDIVATMDDGGATAVSVVNKHPDKDITLTLNFRVPAADGSATVYTLNGDSKDAYNDVDAPDRVKISESAAVCQNGAVTLTVPAHSVNVVCIG